MPRGFSRAVRVCLLAVAITRVSRRRMPREPSPRHRTNLPPTLRSPSTTAAIRAAGIATVLIERERGGTDLSLTGTVAIPQQQIRVVAASAGGLIEEMLVAADEPVQAGQPIAKLRSPAIVEAQRQFLAAIADDALATDRLKRSQLLFEGRALPERDLRVAQTEATLAKSRLDERTQILSLMGMTDAEVDVLRDGRKHFSDRHAVFADRRHRDDAPRRPGERVEPAAAVFTIANLEPLWVNIQVPAARLANLEVGARVTLAGARCARKDHPHRPHRRCQHPIDHRGRGDQLQRRRGAARSRGRRHGPRIRHERAASEWTVPAAAVVRHRDRSWTFVRSKDGFKARPVQVVAENARGVSIRAAFEPGDQVAVRGVLSLLATLAEIDKD